MSIYLVTRGKGISRFDPRLFILAINRLRHWTLLSPLAAFLYSQPLRHARRRSLIKVTHAAYESCEASSSPFALPREPCVFCNHTCHHNRPPSDTAPMSPFRKKCVRRKVTGISEFRYDDVPSVMVIFKNSVETVIEYRTKEQQKGNSCFAKGRIYMSYISRRWGKKQQMVEIDAE